MIDCHYHLDETMVSVSGLVKSMDAAGIEKMALIARICPPIAPVRVPDLLVAAFIRALHGEEGWFHRAGLRLYQRTVLGNNRVDLMGQGYDLFPQPPNEDVAVAVAAHPDRFYFYVFVNPVGPADPVAEIERFLGRPGLIGVKAHPFWHDYPVARLREAAALCEEKGLVMLVHLGVGDKGDYQYLPRSFPRLRIIYAHAGIPYSAAICDYAREHPNVNVDLSSSSYVNLRTAREAVRRAGPDRCLFGSDGPYFHCSEDRFDFKPFVEMIARLGLVEEDRERVTRRNFEELIAGGAR